MGFSSNISSERLGNITAGVTQPDSEAAAQLIARHAKDADDERLLLEACGLIPCKPGEPPKPAPEKSAVIRHNRPGQH